MIFQIYTSESEKHSERTYFYNGTTEEWNSYSNEKRESIKRSAADSAAENYTSLFQYEGTPQVYQIYVSKSRHNSPRTYFFNGTAEEWDEMSIDECSDIKVAAAYAAHNAYNLTGSRVFYFLESDLDKTFFNDFTTSEDVDKFCKSASIDEISEKIKTLLCNYNYENDENKEKFEEFFVTLIDNIALRGDFKIVSKNTIYKSTEYNFQLAFKNRHLFGINAKNSNHWNAKAISLDDIVSIEEDKCEIPNSGYVLKEVSNGFNDYHFYFRVLGREFRIKRSNSGSKIHYNTVDLDLFVKFVTPENVIEVFIDTIEILKASVINEEVAKVKKYIELLWNVLDVDLPDDHYLISDDVHVKLSEIEGIDILDSHILISRAGWFCKFDIMKTRVLFPN